MSSLLIASTNIGKLREIEAIFACSLLRDFPLELVLPTHLGIRLEVEENGSTYAENAAKKAQAFSQASRLITLADDSGLEVDALDGQPGLHSARYAPWEGATDADRRRYLLKNLVGKPRPWMAHFHCTVAIAVPGGDIFYAEGDCPGEIILEERGLNGFGYDPIFWIPELGQTMAELPMEKKNQLSHRARAVLAAAPVIEKLFRDETA
jgi:XTP/dITP diphosphohydrolase